MHGLHQVRARRSSDSIIPNAVRRFKEGFPLGAWASALALFVLSLPVHSPDLFWHLSAGRWIVSHRAIPFADPFSFTRFGAPWVDFEWGAQLLLYAAQALGGMPALWVFKGVLLVAAFLPVDGLLRDKGASKTTRAAALALWSCAALAQADLRVDLFSAALFAVALRRLEAGRASFLHGFGLFALWANLHAGFPAGLALYAAYALAPRLGGRETKGAGAGFCGAVLGSLLNPYGLAPYAVIFTHGADSVGRWVVEWGPIDWRLRFHRPLIAALLAGAAAARAARRESPALAACAAALALATAVSARFGVYFAAAAAACLAYVRPRPAAVAAGLAAATVLFAWAEPVVDRRDWFSDAYVARRAVDWVVSERGTLGGLRLFNTYEWGGYLGWRLGPEGRVYGDGRYLFHRQLPELQAALEGPDAMKAFVDRNGFEALLIRRYPATVKGVLEYPGGTRREVTRPWYASYLPRDRWALVRYDDQALVFVDRSKVPAAWLAANEFRWVRPGDEEAMDGAVAAGLVTPAQIEAEKARLRR